MKLVWTFRLCIRTEKFEGSGSSNKLDIIQIIIKKERRG